MMRNSQRCFYARDRLGSFHTTKTRSGHAPAHFDRALGVGVGAYAGDRETRARFSCPRVVGAEYPQTVIASLSRLETPGCHPN